MARQLSLKADKTYLDEKHAENVKRFDAIIAMISEANRVSSTERHSINDKLGALTATVAVLGDRAGLDHARRK